MNKMDKIKQEQMEKLSRIQTGDYLKLKLNWTAMYVVVAIYCLILGWVLITR